MAQMTQDEANAVNGMNPPAQREGLGDRLRTLEGTSLPATGTEAQIPICGTDGVPAPKTMSGDATITKDGAVAVGDNKILKKHLKTKTIAVTIAAEASTGTVTDADAINGAILGVYPSAAAGSAIKSVALTAGSGKIDVEMVSAQAAATPATIQVVVLRAT